jgi:hypothetical protein
MNQLTYEEGVERETIRTFSEALMSRPKNSPVLMPSWSSLQLADPVWCADFLEYLATDEHGWDTD